MQTTVSCSDAQQVIAVTSQEMHAMSRGDIGLYFSLLAQDAVLLPPNTTAKAGEELRAWLKDFLDHFTVEWITSVDGEVVVRGDLAYHDYAYRMRSTPKGGGEPVVGTGKGLHVLRRDQQGAWKIVRNIWNAAPEPTL